MTPNDAYHAMREIARKHRDDPEAAHHYADKLLLKILRETGYYRTAEVFEEMPKF